MRDLPILPFQEKGHRTMEEKKATRIRDIRYLTCTMCFLTTLFISGLFSGCGGGSGGGGDASSSTPGTPSDETGYSLERSAGDNTGSCLS